ncbi:MULTISPECIES: universal stress protein [unclassified Caulobacter]|jgi:nucleotide-binding universal stress UspA family protein|uniref:universal stress protein n=1 Tax=unclassified Caulobacter TaxID=2648921 RepID=UPI000781F05E|nr:MULTISPECIES: universal stress protein [unclassified Caulobacter]AZS19320.1 universal stress protein [Caulobacter sp. FWC26]
MYRRIVLAYDSTKAGRAALREGALLAKRCGAKVFLLSVLAESGGLALAEGAHVGAAHGHLEAYCAVLDEGLRKLEMLGLDSTGALVRGEPAQQIGDYARKVRADLVVVGHRKRSLLERWWSGANGAYIVDNLDCSLLVARSDISDQDFEAEFSKAAQHVNA